MKPQTIALFGEAEKGIIGSPIPIQTTAQLHTRIGNPPEDSQGIFCAIQLLMRNKRILFFRVQEEGFSQDDYFAGIYALNGIKKSYNLAALYLPGVGDPEIVHAVQSLNYHHKPLIIMSEKDFYDYLTILPNPAQ